MFMIYLPRNFRVGDRHDVRINLTPARLWWKDADTLVINDTDECRVYIRRPVSDDLPVFYCSDDDGTEYDVGYESVEAFNVRPKSTA